MIGIFGGSGFYEFLDEARTQEIDTPYGPPAASPVVGTVDGINVAFIPRHGRHHEFPPHLVPFRSNVWAMRQLGVERIIGPSAVGSLDHAYAPGEFVVCDQIVDWTHRRQSSFFDGPEIQHLSFADPYCSELRPIAIEACAELDVGVHGTGTVVVIEGPRFSTRAESRFFAAQGWHVINMTQSTEAALVRELGICYATIGVITDYDVGVEGEIPPVTHAKVLERFAASIGTLKGVLRAMIPRAIKTPRRCECSVGGG